MKNEGQIISQIKERILNKQGGQVNSNDASFLLLEKITRQLHFLINKEEKQPETPDIPTNPEPEIKHKKGFFEKIFT